MSTSPISFPQMGKFHALLEKRKVTSNLFQAGFLESGLMADFAEMIGSGQIPDRDTFRKALGMEPLKLEFSVQYNLSLETMFELGNLDSVQDRSVFDRFPRKNCEDRVVTAELVPFFGGWDSLTPEEKLYTAIFQSRPKDMEDATVEELLAFSRHFPGAQHRHVILALGSTAHYKKRMMVPGISRERAPFGDPFIRIAACYAIDGRRFDDKLVCRLFIRKLPVTDSAQV